MLTCSLREADSGDFILKKKREAAHLPVKKAVRNLGAQIENGAIQPGAPWVLGPNLIIDCGGKAIEPNTSEFICIPSSNPIFRPIPITMQLGTGGLNELISTMRVLLKHNFCCGILCIGSGLMVLHYSRLLAKRGHCHVPVLYGQPQTGKTTSLKAALSAFGCHQRTFYSRGSKEAYLRRCCESTFPVGCDDPQSPAVVGQLIVELFNGAKCTLVKGDITPTTSCLVSANFNMSERSK